MNDLKKKYPAVDLEKFTAETILNLGLCSPAFKKFKEQYGSEIHTLASRKADIIQLIEEGKGEWVITFCVKIMTKEKRFNFIRYVLGEVKRDFKGKNIHRVINFLSDHIEGIEDNTQDINNAKKVLIEEINMMDTSDWLGKSLESLYKGMVHLIRACSEGEKITQRLTVTVRDLVEAYALNETSKDEFFPLDNYKISKYKHFGLYAMKLTEIWDFE